MICARCRKEYTADLERCPSDGAPLCEAEDLSRLGLRLGNYELTEILGLGGMGVVYRAIHTILDKPVAIKILCSAYSRRRCHPEDILREARTASRVRHRHIVDVTDFGLTDDGAAFFVMELLEGESLARLLGRLGRLPPVRAVRIVRQIASALGAAHALGIIHRDLKPENVYLLPFDVATAADTADDQREEHDFVKVCDFGLAKVIDMEPSSRTKEGIIAGTPVYMSPEHARCEVVDGRSDIYSLGVAFYQMLTGVLPFQGRSALDFLMAHVSQPVIPPRDRCREIDEDLSAIVVRCLEKDPRHRFATMEELRQDLREWLIAQGREASIPGITTGEHALPPGSEPHGELPTVEEGAVEVQEALTSGRRLRPDWPSEERTLPAHDLPPGGFTDDDRTQPPRSVLVPKTATYSEDDLTLPPEDVPLPIRRATLTASVDLGLTPSERRRRGLLWVGVIAVGLVGVLGIFGARQLWTTRPALSQPAAMIRIALEGLPPKAVAFVDNVPRAERPLVLPRSARQHRVRIEADGYEPEERLVSALTDLRLILNPHRKAVASPAPPTTPTLVASRPDPVPAVRPHRPKRPGHRIGKKGQPVPKAVEAHVEAPAAKTSKTKKTVKPAPVQPTPKPAPKKKGPGDPDWVMDPDL